MNYIIDKIAKANFLYFPFKFIYLEDLFLETHFYEIKYALLYENNIFEYIEFPGGTNKVKRLKSTNSSILHDINEIFSSKKLHDILLDKFNINNNTYYEGGIQKYYSGYEITPHPDIRRKALTFMININPLSSYNIYTHFMRLKDPNDYLEYKNIEKERRWTDWDKAFTMFKHEKNNSLTMFKPDFNTIHAIKLDYDDSEYQRTQIYGNLWYYK